MIPPGSFGDLFLTDSVGNLENNYMLPFIWIGAPYIGNFQIDVTFPEAWLRVTSASGDPIGAIAVYASSVDLDYASTHAAQYEMVDLLVNDQMNTIGGLMYNGACLSIDLYGERGEKTFKSYHIFGDVSLQVRTNTPVAMTVQHASSIDIVVQPLLRLRWLGWRVHCVPFPAITSFWGMDILMKPDTR